MKIRTKIIACTTIVMFSPAAMAELEVGKIPPLVELSGDAGGKVDGTPWSSASLTGKIHAFFYVDPDEKNLNEHLAEALKKADFPDDKFASVAVINMDATWLPNFAIESSLEEKQKKYKRTTYVKDFDKFFVEKWKLTDDTYDSVLFDKEGKVLFSKDGKLTDADVKAFIDLITKNIK